MEITPELMQRLEQLQQKYNASGQDLLSYLDGLLYSDHLNYWDYIHLDVLLNLQTPRTNIPDEFIFIVYHQITELYFKLADHAIEQILNKEDLDDQFFIIQLKRVISYIDNLINSFEIMIDGMDKDQFLKFRMALLPASGFQSAQFRIIELKSTDPINLVSTSDREKMSSENSVEEIVENLYWKKGATELASGKKTLTLQMFEEKYEDQFQQLTKNGQKNNLLFCYRKLPAEQRNNPQLIELLRQFDIKIKVHWPLMHYKSAVRYLQRKPEDVKATGGTNWQKYLAPKNQLIIFFPELWSDDEKANWGRDAIKELFTPQTGK